jgi:predicted DNA-binding transcriptional regulator AlpA
MANNQDAAVIDSAQPLPQVGMSRWNQIAPFLPICREQWRRLGLAGKAPQPIRMGERCTLYRNAEVLRWLADPLGYTANTAEQASA